MFVIVKTYTSNYGKFVTLMSHSYRTIPKISALIKRAKLKRNFLLACVDTGIVFLYACFGNIIFVRKNCQPHF